MSQTVVKDAKTLLAASVIATEECAQHGVTHDALLSGDRRRPVVRARQACMWRFWTELHLSLPQIGWLLGRDHTTVLYAPDAVRGAR